MQSNTITEDNLRTRYRQPKPVQVVRRPVVPDIAERRHAPVLRPVSVAPVQQSEPLSAVVAPPPPPQQQQAPTPTLPERTPLVVTLDGLAAAPVKRSKYLVKPRRAGQITIMVMAAMLFVMGAYVSFGGLRANKEITNTVEHIDKQAQVSGPAATAVDAPSTAKPDINSYKVAADMPRFIRIPSLKTQARVMSLGVKSDGSVATPSNVFDAGWFNQSAKPGSAGGSFISGHVSSWTSDGVFYNLKKATPGMTIEIERGDGTKLAYKVVKTQVYDADHVDMNAAINPVTPGTQGLNIMTCTGKVKKGTSEFDSRLLVMAERVS